MLRFGVFHFHLPSHSSCKRDDKEEWPSESVKRGTWRRRWVGKNRRGDGKAGKKMQT